MPVEPIFKDGQIVAWHIGAPRIKDRLLAIHQLLELLPGKTYTLLSNRAEKGAFAFRTV